jgi:hypothetical protein
VSPVDLTKVLGPIVGVIELKHFLGWDDRVEVAEDKQNREVGIESLHYSEVV